MNGTETVAENTTMAAQGSTYDTVVRPHQVKRGDLYYEAIVGDPHSREVRLLSATNGEVDYRGRRVPVLFITGLDTRNGVKVHYTRAPWDFLTVTRVGTVDHPAPATRAPERTFLY